MAPIPTIRPFDDADTESVVALWRLCNLVVSWNDPYKDIARKLEVGRDLFLVAVVGGAVVGTIMGGYEGHRGWINYLAVHPEQRRTGLGRALMDTIEARLLALGCPKINLHVRTTNPDALQFYEALGYEQDTSILLGKRLIPDD